MAKWPSPERRPRSDYEERQRAYDDDPRPHRNEPARDTRRDYDDAPQRWYPPERRGDPRERPYHDERREPRFRDERRPYRDATIIQI